MGHDHELETRPSAEIVRLRRETPDSAASRSRAVQVRLVRFLLSCAAALLAAAFLSAPAVSAQNSDYDLGVALFQKGEPQAAIPYLLKAVQSQPSQARGWKALGVVYAAMGKYALSEEPFAKACNLDPHLEDACYYYGRALYALDRFEPSLDVLRRALRYEPKAWKIRLGIAQALEALGQAREAEQEFERTRDLCRVCDPRPGNAYALFLIRQGWMKEAVPVATEVLKQFPQSPEAHIHLGRALMEQGDSARALPLLERAVELDATSGQAHLLLAKCYVRLGRTAEAQPHFEAAAKYDAESQGVR
jgi:tetratricopeptide (TPR) repeat protein